jgi:hypothetical protein
VPHDLLFYFTSLVSPIIILYRALIYAGTALMQRQGESSKITALLQAGQGLKLKVIVSFQIKSKTFYGALQVRSSYFFPSFVLYQLVQIQGEKIMYKSRNQTEIHKAKHL